MDGPLSPHNGMRRARRACIAQVHAGAQEAFTLVELLAVMAIVGLLAAIAFTATGGVSERARRDRCRSELAMLAQALEAYRARFGEYPRTGPAANDPAGAAVTDDGPGILFNALAGRRGPGVTLVPVEVRSFLPMSAFALQTEALPPAGTTAQSANAVLDPWGRRYLYCYRSGSAWTSCAPVLLSAGPDGEATFPPDLGTWDGTLLPHTPVNADNLSSNGP